MINPKEQQIAPPAGHVEQLECRGLRPEVRLPVRLNERQRDLLLATMMEPGGLQDACRRAGVTLGMVLGERLRNAAFRRLWEKAQRQRRAILETLLTDMVVQGLLPATSSPTGEAREKYLVGVAQALAGAAAEPSARRGRKPAEPPASAKAASPTDPDELTRLIAEVERRVSEAEVEHGLEPPPRAGDAPALPAPLS